MTSYINKFNENKNKNTITMSLKVKYKKVLKNWKINEQTLTPNLLMTMMINT